MDKLSQRKDSLVNKFNANDRKFHGHGQEIKLDPIQQIRVIIIYHIYVGGYVNLIIPIAMSIQLDFKNVS